MNRIGIIGCGHWGPNHIRIFEQLSNSSAVMCADTDEARLTALRANFVQIRTTRDYRDILKSPDIDAVCIATPTNSHYQLTREALEHEKHVLCEKPLAMSVGECEELGRLAREKKKILMVGHIFLFNQGISRLKDYVSDGTLGKIYYAYSNRTNLGPFRYDVNALWDLAPHDISVFNHLFNSSPLNVSARGQTYLNKNLEDIAFATLEYPGDIMVNLHVSWLDPKKVRQITLVGDKKMVVWDDLDAVGPVKLYDKHVERTSTYYETYGEFKLLSLEGEISIPKIGVGEPLKNQASYFLECIEKNEQPDISDAGKAADVVRTLQAIQLSIQKKGSCIDVASVKE